MTGQLALHLSAVPLGAADRPATPHLTVIVRANPATQGSKQARPIYRGRGAGRQFTGRVAQVESNHEKHRAWRDAVRNAAVDALLAAGDPGPLNGPVRVVAVFTLKKPASAPKRRRTWPTTKPDIDKLLRSTFDALTEAGVWVDDSRVVDERAIKTFPGEHEFALPSPGVHLRIWAINPTSPFAATTEETL